MDGQKTSDTPCNVLDKQGTRIDVSTDEMSYWSVFEARDGVSNCVDEVMKICPGGLDGSQIGDDLTIVGVYEPFLVEASTQKLHYLIIEALLFRSTKHEDLDSRILNSIPQVC